MNEVSRLYEIRVQGHLAPRRLRSFEGLAVRQEPNGETVIVGPVGDQAALYGLLNWLHNIGVALLSVRRLEGADSNAEDGRQSR
jgi:hypothetical protein